MTASGEQPGWLAGFASVDITPPDGDPIGTFPVKHPDVVRRAEGAHDRLTATALALGDDAGGLIVCGVDSPALRGDLLHNVRRLVAQRDSAVPVDRVIIAASHTHHALDTCVIFGTPLTHPSIVKLQEQIADVIVASWRDRRPATLETARTHADLTHNRRVRNVDGKWTMAFDRQPGVTTGPVDDEVPVWRVTRDDGAVAVLFQLTAHGLAIGPANRVFSADFPGAARARIAAGNPSVMPLFVNGAAGNVHPMASMKPDFSAVDMIGGKLGDAVVDALASMTAEPAGPIRALTRSLDFVNRVDPKLTVTVELLAAAVGRWLVLTVPGEWFVEFQLRLKAALTPTPVLLIGYANGWPGYIPTLEAFSEGGYGVDLHTLDPPQFSRTSVPPYAGEAIYDNLLQMAKHLKDSCP